jgi:hypothetical protein
MNVIVQATASWIRGKTGKREITAMQKSGDIPRSFPDMILRAMFFSPLIILLSEYEPPAAILQEAERYSCFE